MTAEHPTAVLLPAGGDAVSSPFVVRATFFSADSNVCRIRSEKRVPARWVSVRRIEILVN
jgi:hypothetical protein